MTLRRSLGIIGAIGVLCAALPAAAQSLPGPLESAISEAESQSERRFSYTQSFQWRDNEPVVDRYDARTDTWTRLSGDPSDWDNPGEKKLNNWKRIESKPGQLLYADYRDSFENVRLVEETDGTFVYTFTAGQEQASDLDAGVEDKVYTRAIIDKGAGAMTSFVIRATEGFKPNAVSRLDEFIYEQEFSRPAEGIPPVMTRVYWKAIGRQVFSKVDEEYTIVYSDFEPVD